jgi:hypothetical protein
MDLWSSYCFHISPTFIDYKRLFCILTASILYCHLCTRMYKYLNHISNLD